MAKIIFDERFYESDSKDYLLKAINFINKYLDVEAVHLYSTSKQSNGTFTNMKVIIDSLMLKIDNIKDYDEDSMLFSTDINLPYDFTEHDAKVIAYFLVQQEDVIFISIENLDGNAVKGNDNLFIFNHIYKETNSCFARFVAEGKYVKNIVSPSKKSPLPNVELCYQYKGRQDELSSGSNLNELQAIYYSVGQEVLLRNQYIKDSTVSSLNKQVFGGVFSPKMNTSLYASVDIEHGAIEVFDDKGNHLGEYTYDNQCRCERDKTGKHNIHT